MIKKISLIFLSVLIFFLPIQEQRVKANPLALAIPAGIEIGAGAYVVGALLTAGVAGTLGYVEYEEEINEHAKRTWEGANQLAIDSIKASIDASVAVGSTTLTLGQDFIDWFKNTAVPSLEGLFSIPYEELEDQYNTDQWNRIVYSSTDIQMNVPYFNLIVSADGGVLKSGRNSIMVYANGFSIGGSSFSATGSFNYDLSTAPFGLIMSEIEASLASKGYAVDWLNGYVPPTADRPIDNYAEQVDANLEKALNHSVSQGVSIPYSDIIPNSATGLPLTWNPDSQVYKLPDGSIYDPALDGAIGWTMPVPKVVTDTVTGQVVIDDATGIAKTEVITGEGVVSDPITTTFPTPTVLWFPPSGGTFNPSNPIPIAMAIALFDLLVAIIAYIGRLVEFILTIPTIPEILIENYGFQWFKTAEIVGIRIYDVVMSMGLIGLSFLVFKAIRKVMP